MVMPSFASLASGGDTKRAAKVLARPGYTPLAAQPSPEHMAAIEAVCGWYGGSSMSLIGARGVGSFGSGGISVAEGSPSGRLEAGQNVPVTIPELYLEDHPSGALVVC